MADDLFQPPRDLPQQFVTGRVAHGVVDLFEPVEVEHHQPARPPRGLVGRKRRLQPARNTVAVGKAGQRIVFGQPRFLQLALVFGGNVLGAAAIAQEFPLGSVLGQRGDRPPGPPCRPALFQRGQPHHQLVDPLGGVQLELQRAVGLVVGVVRVGLEEVGKGFSDQVFYWYSKVFSGALRKIDQPALRIAGP